METKIFIILMLSHLFIFLLGIFSVVVIAYKIQKKDIEKQLKRNITFKEFLSLDRETLKTDDKPEFSPINNDLDIFYNWLANFGYDENESANANFDKKMLLNFANYYHQKKKKSIKGFGEKGYYPKSLLTDKSIINANKAELVKQKLQTLLKN